MFIPGLGETAALATAVSWSACAQFFAAAGRRVGSVAVNHIRLILALLLLPLMHRVVIGTFLPRDAGSTALLLLVASGFIGLTLGDAAGFRALVMIGPARTTLVVTLTPAIAAILAAAFLGERLRPLALVGMAVTIAGLLVGVIGRFREESRMGAGAGASVVGPRVLVVGLLFAVGGAVGQAMGQVLAKPALATVDPLSATLVRVAAGAALLWGFTLVQCAVRRAPPRWMGAWRDGKAMGLTALGTLTGPICGVWLSQVATKHAEVGVAATLMALVPLFVLAEDALIRRRRPAGHELLGALIAILGVVLLVWACLP